MTALVRRGNHRWRRRSGSSVSAKARQGVWLPTVTSPPSRNTAVIRR